MMGNDWSLVAFSALSCLSCGLMWAVTIGERKEYPQMTLVGGSVISLIALLIAAFFGLGHLGHPEMILGTLSHPTSALFIKLVSAVLLGLTLIAYLIATYRESNESTTKFFTYCGSLFALLLLFGIGKNYVMQWRDAWNTYTLVLPVLGWGIAAGALSYTLLQSIAEGAKADSLKLVLASLAICLVLNAIYFITLAVMNTEQTMQALNTCLSGHLAGLFWGGLIGVGLIASTVLYLILHKQQFIASVLGLICVLVGSAVYQMIVSQLGTAVWQFFKKAAGA